MSNDMNTLIIFISLGVALALFFRHLKTAATQKAAAFQLYAVRDELICLVAEKKLSEDSRLFQYYYKRINRLLALVPNVGLDNTMEAFLYLKNSKSFQHSLNEANRRADEMLKLVEEESEEVSTIISNYYAASKCLMLAHSSVLRMLYIALVKTPINNSLKSFVPKATYAALKTVSFADEEANRFRDVGHQQAA